MQSTLRNGINFKEPVKVMVGDVIDSLKQLPSECIDCAITSPPYWMQRDYGHPEQIGREETPEEYIEKLTMVFSELRRVLKKTGTFFLNVGDKYQGKNLLMIPEKLAISLQKNGWILRNKIIWYKPNFMPAPLKDRLATTYEPVFFLVKDEGAYIYYFNIDEIRKQPKTINDFRAFVTVDDILGMNVYDSLNKEERISGHITGGIYDSNKKLVGGIVVWNGKRTKEYLHEPSEPHPIEPQYLCPKCGANVEEMHSIYDVETITCGCGAELLSDLNSFPIPLLPPLPEFKEEVVKETPRRRSEIEYNGKFKGAENNKGASPGARLELYGEYFTLQRRYAVIQPLIAQYLRLWRKKKGLTIKEIDHYFGYKDTAGHWFRRDFGDWGGGGSVPLPKDWLRLKELLGFDNTYDELVTRTHLVFQTVKPHPKGKNPGDLWQINTQPITEAHFAVFPEELVENCIKIGCPKGGIVLDPFAGSGTTGVAALKLQRKAVLIELVEDYVEIIKKRCGNKIEIIRLNS